MLNVDCDGTVDDARKHNDSVLLWQTFAWHCVRTFQHAIGGTAHMSQHDPHQSNFAEPPLDAHKNHELTESTEVIRDLAERATRPSAPKLTALSLVLIMVVMGSLAAASLLPVVKFPGDAGNYVGHLVAYALATGCLMALAKLRPWVAASGLCVFGIAIEFIQPSVGREAHVEDVLANTLGIAVAWCAVVVWRRLTMRRRVTSTRVEW